MNTCSLFLNIIIHQVGVCYREYYFYRKNHILARYDLFMMTLKASNSILVIASVFSFSLIYANNLILFVYASPALPTTLSTSIPNAESVYLSESMKIPQSVGTFVILIPNEAHENWSDEKHKLITDKNSYYVPTNLIVPNGTALVFLHADAPWDTPNPHTIEIQDSSSGNVVYNTGQLDYTLSSKPIIFPSPGTYNIVDKSYDTKESKITVLDNVTSSGKSIIGGFYTPTNQVENIEDNDGGTHPGSLQYYKEAFSKDGFDILSEYNFTYAACDYCPGEYWPDNKSGEHTLFIYSTQQPLTAVLEKLGKLVKDNVYI